MAIDIDKVYKTVLAVVNKEQRGYITPDEFNDIAKQAQLSIIDSMMVEYNDALNKKKSYRVNNGFADSSKMLREQLDEIYKSASITFSGGTATLPTDHYKIQDISSSDRITKYEEISKSEIGYILSSPLTSPMASFPVFYRDSLGTTIEVKPNTTALDAASVLVDYIKLPDDPRWGYLEDAEYGAFVYDPNPYIEGALVIKTNALLNISTEPTAPVDGLYLVSATISTGGTVALVVTISGNIVTNIDVTGTSSGVTPSSTVTVAGTEFGGSGFLVVDVDSGDLYENSVSGSIGLELHPSLETRMVEQILMYSGIVIRDQTITTMAAQIAQLSRKNNA
tara:strand:- start:30433 stop:31443 length:1011 start_codon:yes stop_codon:yes gene_type:complete